MPYLSFFSSCPGFIRSQPLQVVAKSMMDALSTDAMISLLNTGEPNSWRVNSILSVLLGDTADVLKSMEAEKPQFPEVIVEALNRIFQICSAYVAVLNPQVGHLGSSDKDAAVIRGYKGKEPVEAMFSKPLRAGFYGKLFDEMLKKGATAREADPILKSVSSAIIKDYGVDSLSRLVDKLPSLRESLRKGATHELETLVLERVKKSADVIVEGSTTSSISADQARWTEVVFNALKLFVDQPGVLDLMHSVEEWKSGNSAHLAVAHLECKVADVATCKDIGSLDLRELSQALQSAGNISKAELTEGQTQIFQVAVCNIFRHLKLKVLCLLPFFSVRWGLLWAVGII